MENHFETWVGQKDQSWCPNGFSFWTDNPAGNLGSCSLKYWWEDGAWEEGHELFASGLASSCEALIRADKWVEGRFMTDRNNEFGLDYKLDETTANTVYMWMW